MSQIDKKSLPWRLLMISLAIIVLFSFLASMFNTGMFSVSVSRINFDTEHGELSGLLYMPKGASAEDPRPTIIVTHGYLNSAEMQDANAIELSRRGYVVLALDMYDHGHSDLNDTYYNDSTDFMATWTPFWLYSMYDAVQEMYKKDYVLKDEAGNGIIGVTGHSMGGFSSTVAVARDEIDYAETGIRKIRANLTEGSDFSYCSYFPPYVSAASFDAAGGGRYLGKVAAQYDEFFFNAPDAPAGTVRQKDYVSTPDGLTFLQQVTYEMPEAPAAAEDEIEAPAAAEGEAPAEEAPAPAPVPVYGTAEANTWYDTSDGGHRIIYEPAETHPWNHFSTTTTGNVVNFYNTAFADYVKEAPADGGSQIWYLKEICECIALVGFVLFILAVAKLLLALPFFSKANTGTLPVQPKATGASLWIGLLIMIIAILLPAILFETMYDWNPESTGMWILFGGALAIVLLAGISFALKGATKKQKIFGCVAAVLSGGGLAALTRISLYTDAGVFTAPVVNSIAKWTVGSMFISLCIMSVVFLYLKAKNGITLKDYGVTFKPMAIISGLCTAIVSVAAAYGLLFLVDLIFKTDFRIWTFAFKTFDGNILPAIARYIPTFLAYYIVSTTAICINTNTERLKGWKGYLVAIALNCGGIIIWLARQYITLFSTGVAAHPGADLSGIVLVAMVPTLAIAACVSRYLYKRTGNIWAPAFLNGILMTIMAVANTTVFFK